MYAKSRITAPPVGVREFDITNCVFIGLNLADMQPLFEAMRQASVRSVDGVEFIRHADGHILVGPISLNPASAAVERLRVAR